MSEARNARYVNEYAAPVEPLTFVERWTRWQESGAWHDERVGRNMRLIAMVALTLGAIWFFVVLR